MDKCVRARGGAHNHTHLISGRAARRTSCAFAACVVACNLCTVVGLCFAAFCVRAWCLWILDGMHIACCSILPHSVLCSGLNSDITVAFAISCCLALVCSVLFCAVCCVISCSAYLLSILSCLGLIRYGRVVPVCFAMSSYRMLRASPIWSFLFSVLVCVVHVVLPYV